MLPYLFVVLACILPSTVHSSCCRLPFTSGECQVNRQGPHRYRIMPDRRSGLVQESTECYINDFDANYRKVVQSKNYCNDCPGLLVLHTNSSEIFLFPIYLERILEGLTSVQRENVVIVTHALVGAYDLDFTLFSRYYADRRETSAPLLYIDLQLPPFDPARTTQATLRLRLPDYSEDNGLAKIGRNELLDPSYSPKTAIDSLHQLPFVYHFDMRKHTRTLARCTLYDIQVGAKSLIWTKVDSGAQACQRSTALFGRNRCFATGFTRLFCPIDENIRSDDALDLSSYAAPSNRVEHLTVAVTGGRQVTMSLSNNQMRPAEQVKILLLQGHLEITSVNENLNMRVEYGSNCADFSVLVSDIMSVTRYHQFDEEIVMAYGKDDKKLLPACFRVIPSRVPAPQASIVDRVPFIVPDPSEPIESEQDMLELDEHPDELPTNLTRDAEASTASALWDTLSTDHNLAYTITVALIALALIPCCLGLIYLMCCRRHRKSSWNLEQSAHTNPSYVQSIDQQTVQSISSHVDTATQTREQTIRI